jgi:hypothetical protein
MVLRFCGAAARLLGNSTEIERLDGAGLQAHAQVHRTRPRRIEAVTRVPIGMAMRAASVTMMARGRRTSVNWGHDCAKQRQTCRAGP